MLGVGFFKWNSIIRYLCPNKQLKFDNNEVCKIRSCPGIRIGQCYPVCTDVAFFSEDEVADLIRETAAAGQWESVTSAEEADFIIAVQAKKKMVFNSPRTWLTPSVSDKEGNVLWKGDTYKADATMFNGYRATNTAISKMVENGFNKDLFKAAGR